MANITSRVQSCCIKLSDTLLQALRAINDGTAGIALALDVDGKLHGILTDGNIRRALLAGASLNSPITEYLSKEFISVTSEVGRNDVLELMQARHIHQVPVIDNENKLVGLHLLYDILGMNERPNYAVIMAGGRGTRLSPLTENLPKPMIRVAGKPILERILLHLVSYGIRNFYISVNYLGAIIEEYFGDGSQFGCSIEYLHEDEPLGTGGAISLIPDKLQYPFILLNGDLITEVNIDHLLAFHTSGGYIATMGVKRYFHHVPYGCIETKDNNIVALIEKPTLEKLVNAGVYVINPELIDIVPRQFFPITKLIEQYLNSNKSIGAFEILEEWTDIGQHNELHKARTGQNLE